MDSRALWQRYREGLIDHPELGFRLDASRMAMPSDFAESFSDRMHRAFDAMEALERGAIANPDENRMVGHYWLRAPELAPQPEIRTAIERTRDAVIEFAARVHRGEVRPERADRFEHLLLIGIGGSALGPQLVARALGGEADRLRPWFLDNTDPDGIDRVLGALGERLQRTLVLVVSKSGGTPETRNGMLETEAAYRERNLAIGPHAVAVTQEGSRLDRFARDRGFVASFPMWDWIGGRTSVTSAVGLLPAALQGIEVREMLAGAAAMDVATRLRDPRRNPAALMSLAWHHAGRGRGERDMVILPYKDRLELLSRYLQQLIMESLGKERDLDGRVVHQGIAVYGNKGSTDQHAYVQQLREGVDNFFVTFVEVLRDRAAAGIAVEEGATSGDFLQGFLVGTRHALHEAGRPSMTITLRELTPRTLGGLLALYERAVGLYASLVHVNAYHQPGVEAGKKAAASVLDLLRRTMAALREAGARGGTAERIATSIGAEAEMETIFMLLERLSANPDRGIARSEGSTPFDAVYRLSS